MKGVPGSRHYRLIIVGGGPGGLTAGLYASRAQIATLLLEKGATGGQVLVTDWLENYPGFPEGISGFALGEKFSVQARRFGLEVEAAEVVAVEVLGARKSVTLESGEKLTCEALIVATGARPNHLGVPGEKEFSGKGVSYCATCDAPFYREQEIAVVGGGDTAIKEAIYLSKFARKVTVIHRRERLRAERALQDQAFANPRIAFLWEARVARIVGTKGVEAVQVVHNDGREIILPVQGVFVLIGIKPNNELLPLELLRHEQGLIVTDCRMRTNIPGVLAVGDIRSCSARQVVTAAGDGAVAVKAAEEYIEQLAREAGSAG